jgi:hypothetical protein
MPRGKTHGPERTVATLRQIEVSTGHGTPVADAIRPIGVTEATYDRRRQGFGAQNLDRVRRPEELEAGNTRRRKAVAEPHGSCPLAWYSWRGSPRCWRDRYGQADAVTLAERGDGLRGHVAGTLDRPLKRRFQKEGADEPADRGLVRKEPDGGCTPTFRSSTGRRWRSCATPCRTPRSAMRKRGFDPTFR